MAPIITELRAVEIIAALTTPGADENEIVEFKSNHLAPQIIGEYISALANAAALKARSFAYLVFGVEDKTLQIVGTTFSVESKAAGNQSLVPWLHGKLSEEAHFDFHEVDFGGKRLVLLVVRAAQHLPITFNKIGWCRVKSHKKKLSDHRALEKDLWRALEQTPLELGAASDVVTSEEVLDKLDYATYFDLRDIPLPREDDDVIDELVKVGMIVAADVTGWYITNMGALLLARSIDDFPAVSRKSARLTRYSGTSKAAEASEVVGSKGYAVGFAGLVSTARKTLPSRESFEGGIRRNVPPVSERVLRELIANALIHQDLAAQGTGPTIEIYEDRVEIANPGESLIPPDRIIDSSPKSRNEKFAFAGRSMGMCDERGSGWDLVGDYIESEGLPAPLIESSSGFMRVTVWWKREFGDYTKDELLRALLFHSLVQHAKRQRVTNASVKVRFGLPEKDGGKASKLLGAAVLAGMLKVYDSAAGYKNRSYVPYFVETD